jgi:hypothetical protein
MCLEKIIRNGSNKVTVLNLVFCVLTASEEFQVPHFISFIERIAVADSHSFQYRHEFYFPLIHFSCFYL